MSTTTHTQNPPPLLNLLKQVLLCQHEPLPEMLIKDIAHEVYISEHETTNPPNNAIKELIETYQRRLKAITDLIVGTENTGSHEDTRRFERWYTKKAEYKAIIHELETLVNP